MTNRKHNKAPTVAPPGNDNGIELTPAQKKMRRARNIAIGVALAAFVAIIYSVTVAKLGVNVLKRPL